MAKIKLTKIAYSSYGADNPVVVITLRPVPWSKAFLPMPAWWP